MMGLHILTIGHSSHALGTFLLLACVAALVERRSWRERVETQHALVAVCGFPRQIGEAACEAIIGSPFSGLPSPWQFDSP